MYYCITFVKCSPSLTNGAVGNVRLELITILPFFNSYILLIMRSKSEVFFTGKNRLLRTLIPIINNTSIYIV